MINSNVSSFQNGVNTLYDKCVSCGVTPSAKTPAAISTAIQSIYTNGYNAGVASGKATTTIVCARIQPYHYGESAFNIGTMSIPSDGTYRTYFACNDGSWSYATVTIGGNTVLNIPTYNNYTGDTKYATSADRVCKAGDAIGISAGSYLGTMVVIIYKIS